MKVIIVGYGWLGRQLAPKLVASGYQVIVTSRQQAALNNLPTGISGLVLDLAAPVSVENNELSLTFADAWVISAISPAKQQSSQHYAQVLQHLATFLQQAKSRAVIHFSSSGIYQGLSGRVDETAVLERTAPKVAQLAEGELQLQRLTHCTTLRLAGLMGRGRHPGRFVAGKILGSPLAAVNMIHADDVISTVLSILQNGPAGQQLFNLSYPTFCARQRFYLAAVEALGCSVQFTGLNAENGRQVCSQRVLRKLQPDWRYTDAIAALSDCD